MSTEAWPFLISRNKYIDYGVIEAPSFVIESAVSERLIDITMGDTMGDKTEPGKALLRTVRDENGEELTLVFRVARAQLDGQNLMDGHSRPILWVIGFFLKGSARDISVTEEDFQKVHGSVIEDYRKFWDQTEHLSITSSKVLDLPLDNSTTGKRLDVVVGKETYVVSPTQKKKRERRRDRRISKVILELVDDKHRLAEEVRKAVFSPRGDTFAVLGMHEFAFFRLREQSNFERVYEGSPSAPFLEFSTLAFSPGGKYLALVDHKWGNFRQKHSAVFTWDCDEERNKPNEPVFELRPEISAVSFSPEGRYVVCGGKDRDLYVYDRETEEDWPQRIGHTKEITAVTFSPQGQTCASGGRDGVRIWKLVEEREGWASPTDILTMRQVIPDEYRQSVRAVTFSPDGRLLATQRDDAITIHETSNYVNQWTLEPQKERWFTSVAFAADSRTLITSGERLVKFWNVVNQQEIPVDWQIDTRSTYVTSLDISPDGEFLLCGFKDGTVHVYKLQL